MDRHLFLIGFMGSGKTHWGKMLAEALDRPFVDLDEVISEMAGQSIPEVFATWGEAAFRDLEARSLHRLSDRLPAVVATGGGTPCFHDNLNWMKMHGSTIYLDTPVEVLADRLKSEQVHRPLIAGVPPEGLPELIQALLNRRLPFYEQAATILHYEPGADDEFFKQLLTAVS
jgi:shikimate kinase